MFKFNRLFIIPSLSIFFIAVGAHSASLSYDLSATFDTGGTISGTFDMDSITGLITSISVTTTEDISLGFPTTIWDISHHVAYSPTSTIGGAIFILNEFKKPNILLDQVLQVRILPADLGKSELPVAYVENLEDLGFYAASRSSRNPNQGDQVVATLSSTAAVPEPSTVLLLGTGLVGLVGYRYCRRNAA